MYKMIVIDDEYLVRLGIKETIEWDKYKIEIVGEATNGKTGLELIKSLKPDIIITDIKMPVMDGLELVKELSKLNYDHEVIILSGYKDFDYAKHTLENGAFSYLLKPIDNQELIEKVMQAIEHLEENKKQKTFIKHKLIQDLIMKKDSEINEETLKLYDIYISKEGTIIYGKIDELNKITEAFDKTKAIKLLNEYIMDLLKIKGINHYNYLSNNEFYLICSSAYEACEKVCEEALIKYEKESEIIVSLGLSSYIDISLIYEASIEAKQYTENKLYPMINTVSSKNSHVNINPLIHQAMRYIAQNYSRNITVKMVADSLFVSESHLMHLFKDSINKTFNECLTDYRILVAKQLLLSGKLKVYEVAELVGYKDSKYFSQIFKKKVGLSPNQFIEIEVMK